MYKSLYSAQKTGKIFLCTYNVQPYIVSALKKYLFWFFNGISKFDLAIMMAPKLFPVTVGYRHAKFTSFTPLPLFTHTAADTPVCVRPFYPVNKPPLPTNIWNNDTKSFSSCIYRPLLIPFKFPLPDV